MATTSAAKAKNGERPSLWTVAAYFLRLGTFGFGGPIALAAYMQRDLVGTQHWFTQDEYSEGLAMAQLAPGPMAAQLAMYLGYVLNGVGGATVVALAFIGPSFLMVLALAGVYVRYGGLSSIQAVFYGVGAAVIGIIGRSCIKLVQSSLKRDFLLYGIAATLAAATAITEREIVWLFLGGGVLSVVVKTWRSRASRFLVASLPISVAGGTSAGKLVAVFVFFLKAGLFVFGSGLAIVPFLHGGVVLEHHWLSERQFVDAVAVAMITPGPVVITVSFIGFLVAGTWGAVAAGLGVFLPVYLIVICCVPWYRRYSENPQLRAFVAGVTAAAVGAITGAVIVLARRTVHDVPTALIALGTFGVLFRFKIPEPLLIVMAALLGLVVYRF